MACRREIRACSCVPCLGTATPSRRCRSQTASTPPLLTAPPSERTREPCCDCGFRPDWRLRSSGAYTPSRRTRPPRHSSASICNAIIIGQTRVCSSAPLELSPLVHSYSNWASSYRPNYVNPSGKVTVMSARLTCAVRPAVLTPPAPTRTCPSRHSVTLSRLPPSPHPLPPVPPPIGSLRRPRARSLSRPAEPAATLSCTASPIRPHAAAPSLPPHGALTPTRARRTSAADHRTAAHRTLRRTSTPRSPRRPPRARGASPCGKSCPSCRT